MKHTERYIRHWQLLSLVRSIARARNKQLHLTWQRARIFCTLSNRMKHNVFNNGSYFYRGQIIITLLFGVIQ